MKRASIALATAVLGACAASPFAPSGPARPPETRQDPVVDDYFGTRVADPYRWLESLDAPDTRAWVEAQNAFSGAQLEHLPARGKIRRRLAKLWNYERYSAPDALPSGALVYTHNDGLQNQPELLIEEPGQPPRVLLDPNTWSQDGTEALTHWQSSPDGRHLLYAVQSGGSDWVEYRLMELPSGRALPDRLTGINFNFDASRISWRGGNAGFFYSRFPPAPAGSGAPPSITHQQLYWHRVGTTQDQDVKVYERPDHPTWFSWGEASDDGRYLLVYVEQNEDQEKQVYVRDLGRAESPVPAGRLTRLVGDFSARWYLVGNEGPVLYFRTSDRAPRFRVVAIDLRKPDRAHWRDVVPQSEDVLDEARMLGGEIVTVHLHDAASRLNRWSTAGERLGEIPLPGLGTAGRFSGSATAPVFYYRYSSFTQPLTIYRHDLRSGSTPFHAPKLAFDPADFVTQEVFFTSKDGTRVPMFLSRRRDLPHGPAPVLLNGYGGFAIAQTPTFRVPALVWMERGGIFAQVSLRGGSEYGESWHRAGMLANKQNVFDDFAAAAEYLIREKRTTAAQLAIQGRSNGGLLMGASINQHPELFAAANVGVGVLDMLRYHRFGIAYAWAGDYGTSATKDGFRTLRAYSPVHTVKSGMSYPATLITTADHDDRVHPLHSYKYAAALQAAQGGDAPILLRVDTRSGHGMGTALSKQIEESADVLAFLEYHTRPH